MWIRCITHCLVLFELARVKHFVDVCLKGIGGAMFEALWERGWLPNPAGLYKLTQVGLRMLA
jgi:NAD-dependent DNA ligase